MWQLRDWTLPRTVRDQRKPDTNATDCGGAGVKGGTKEFCGFCKIVLVPAKRTLDANDTSQNASGWGARLWFWRAPLPRGERLPRPPFRGRGRGGQGVKNWYENRQKCRRFSLLDTMITTSMGEMRSKPYLARLTEKLTGQRNHEKIKPVQN